MRGQFGGGGFGWDPQGGDRISISLSLSLFAISSHIRHAWDHTKSVRQNLAEMGLAMDPNKAVPLRKRKVLMKQGPGTFSISTLALLYFPYPLSRVSEFDLTHTHSLPIFVIKIILGTLIVVKAL